MTNFLEMLHIPQGWNGHKAWIALVADGENILAISCTTTFGDKALLRFDFDIKAWGGATPSSEWNIPFCDIEKTT